MAAVDTRAARGPRRQAEPSLIAVGLVLLGLGLAGCVTVPTSEDPVVMKIGELEARLEELEGRLRNDGVVSLVGELQRLQEEVRLLRGEVDVTRNEVDKMGASQRTLFVQLDDRMSALESGGGGAPGMPQAGAAPDLAAPLPAADLYDQGFELLKQQQYAQAGDVFAELVRTQPNSSLAGAAQYWHGETYYVRRQFTQARDAFQKVLRDYPRSNKVPDAQLKLGFCYYELEEWARARTTLQEVMAQHAGTPAAKLAGERLDRMQREGR